MNSQFGKAMNSAQYAANWQATAESNSASGAYAWMASNTLQPQRLIEIGCGSGHSTASLLAKGARILAIDENKSMIDRAVKHLKQFCSVEKLTLADMPNFDWDTGSQVKILHANIFSPAFPDSLPSGAEAIMCWIIGARPEAISSLLQIPLQQFRGPEMPRYREELQKRVFALGAQILKPGGTVHVVDRMGTFQETESEAIAADAANHMAGIAGPAFNIPPSCVRSTKLEAKTFKASNIQYHAPVKGAESLFFISTLAQKI